MLSHVHTALQRPAEMPASREASLALVAEHRAAYRFDEAAQVCHGLLKKDRRDTEVILLMGAMCCDVGLFDGARQLLEEALAIEPTFLDARRQLAVALRSLGRSALLSGDAPTAAARLTAALTYDAEHADTLNCLGLAQLQLGRHKDAETSLIAALRLRPELTQARNNLALSLQYQGRLHEAQLNFEETVRRDPTYMRARVNLANVLRIVGSHTAARSELEKVLAVQPEAVDALNSLAAVFQDLGQPDLALETLTRALALEPAIPQIRWNLAMTQLALGDYANGWSNFESRWEGCDTLKGAYRMPKHRAWRGEPLQGRRLLLWAEQGFGDTLQFIRFAKHAAVRGAVVSVEVQPELAALVRTAPGVSAVIPHGQVVPQYDFHCPLMSLPHFLGALPTVSASHGATPYLFAKPANAEEWRGRLNGHGGLKVGLAWAGRSRSYSAELIAVDARRSFSLAGLQPLLKIPGCSFFSLQKQGTAGAPVHDYSSEWHDFSDTAAFVINLDLVITVDTAVAHLAGALGKPVWLLNRYDTCWRWLLGRSDSPWYGTVRQFRQPEPGAWDPVIQAVAAALAVEVESRSC
jgi:Flp pilus assembly protein TadD